MEKSKIREEDGEEGKIRGKKVKYGGRSQDKRRRRGK